MSNTQQEQNFTEQDILSLEKRLEQQKLQNKMKQIDPDVYNLNRIALTKTIKAVKAIMSKQLKDPKTGQQVEGILPNGQMESYMYITAKDTPPPFMSQSVEVYEDRYKFLVCSYFLLSMLMIFQGPSWKVITISGVLMYFWYDFFSGILHIVLDEPKNLTSWRNFALFKPCLEFQWHHVIPADIASKGIHQSCGDLNFVISLVMTVNFVFFGIYKYPIALCLGGWKLFFSYFGQYCHKMAHTIECERPSVVKLAQKLGLMISEQAHRVHHTDPHDDNFCIGSGVFNGAIRACRDVTLNPNLWFTVFGFALFFDFFAFQSVVKFLCGM